MIAIPGLLALTAQDHERDPVRALAELLALVGFELRRS